MGERADETEEQIDRTREDFKENLNELEEKVKSAFDWRAQFEEHPFAMLSLALGGGMVAAALISGGRRKRDTFPPASTRRNVRNAADKAEMRETNGSLDSSKGAFLTAVAARMGSFLGALLAEYRDEKHRREGRYSAT